MRNSSPLTRFLTALMVISALWGAKAIAELDHRYYEQINVDAIFAHDDCLYVQVSDYRYMTICGAENLSELEQKAGYLRYLIEEGSEFEHSDNNQNP